jgi:hypothetical protein
MSTEESFDVALAAEIEAERSGKRRKEPFRVTDLHAARWVAKKLITVHNRLAEIDEQAERELDPLLRQVEKVKDWQRREHKRHDGTRYTMERLLKEYLTEQRLKDDSYKSVDLGPVRVRSKVQADGWEGLDRPEVKEWAIEDGRFVTKNLDAKALAAQLTNRLVNGQPTTFIGDPANGELLPWVTEHKGGFTTWVEVVDPEDLPL